MKTQSRSRRQLSHNTNLLQTPDEQAQEPSVSEPVNTAVNDGAQVKMALFGRPIPELLQYARRLHESMEDNPNFREPQPPQDEFEAVLAVAQASTSRASFLKNAYAAAIASRDQAIQKLLRTLDQRGNYVQMKSGGNAARILSAGIEVRRERRPVPVLYPPAGLSVELNGLAGVVILTWYKVMHAKLYLVEYGPVDGPMTQRFVNGPRKLMLSDLPIGKMYQFRVCTIGGASGQSQWGQWVKRGIA